MNGSKNPMHSHDGMCNGAFCRSGGGWHGFFLFRVLLTIIIVMVVFMAGVRFGELKAIVMGDRHGGYMMYRGYDANGYPGMMAPVGTAVPQAATTTP
jgi:hypothetical protein